MKKNKQYILYDIRAISEGTEDAVIFEVCDTLEEAKEASKEYGQCCIYEYDVEVRKGKRNRLINERLITIL